MVAVYSRILTYWNLYSPSDQCLGIFFSFFSVMIKRLCVHVYVCV